CARGEAIYYGNHGYFDVW
nr:immunoglobulin heavy chain junction region [Mus musculus]